MKRVILIHGWEGEPEKEWRPWLKKELTLQGFEVIVPAMPDTNNPSMAKWVSHLGSVVPNPDQDTYIIGHSLGCVTILRYLETLEENQNIGGAILVAGFGKDLEYKGYKGELSSFFEKPIDWEKIKKHCTKFIAINSKDDKFVSIENNKLFVEKLNAKSIVQDGMGHYSGGDGFSELPIVRDLLLEISSQT